MPKKKKLYDLLNKVDRKRVRTHFNNLLKLFHIRDTTAKQIDDITSRYHAAIAAIMVFAKINPYEVNKELNLYAAKIRSFTNNLEKALITFTKVVDEFAEFDMSARKKIDALPRNKKEYEKSRLFAYYSRKANEIKKRLLHCDEMIKALDKNLKQIEAEKKQTWN